jgi:hypothetical protein
MLGYTYIYVHIYICILGYIYIYIYTPQLFYIVLFSYMVVCLVSQYILYGRVVLFNESVYTYILYNSLNGISLLMAQPTSKHLRESIM